MAGRSAALRSVRPSVRLTKHDMGILQWNAKSSNEMGQNSGGRPRPARAADDISALARRRATLIYVDMADLPVLQQQRKTKSL